MALAGPRPRGRRAAALFAVCVAGVGAAVAWPRGADEGAFTRRGLTVHHFTVHSALLGRDLRAIGVVPADRGPRPLLVFLHGRGGGVGGQMNAAFATALAALGSRAPAVVFPFGEDHSYWHDRGDGAWGAYVVREVIPQAAEALGADGNQVAIGGISMGGFGAYDLARRYPRRFCAVAGHSPAIWRTGGETAPGAFDDAEDFTRHDIVASAARGSAGLRATRLWLDAGTGDPFDPGDRAFVAALRAARVPIEVHRWAGGHTGGYWRAHYADYLGFYARALEACSTEGTAARVG